MINLSQDHFQGHPKLKVFTVKGLGIKNEITCSLQTLLFALHNGKRILCYLRTDSASILWHKADLRPLLFQLFMFV